MKIGKKDDLTLEPSEELNRETLEKMAAYAANAPVKRKNPRMRQIVTCAALVGAMFILMGAGYRVFPQMAYVPGQGIVNETVENAYILQEAVEAGEYYIDGVSVIPVTEGEHKGQWKVTVLTTEPRESPETITFADDNSKVLLEKENGDSRFTRYTGYIADASAGQYTIGLEHGIYSVELSRLSQSPYVNYKYPVEQGIQAVIYPLTDGSDKLIVNFSLEYLSEDLRYWAKHSQNINVYLDWDDFLLTDTEGNTYRMSTGTTSSIRIPLTEEKKSMYPYLRFDKEAIYFLDRRLEAPIAEIQFGIVRLSFSQIRNTVQYTLTIPANGETIVMPEDTYLLNSHGIQEKLLSADAGTYVYAINRKEYNAFFINTTPPVHSFPENITDLTISFSTLHPKDPTKTIYESMGSWIQMEGRDVPDSYLSLLDWREMEHTIREVHTIRGDGTRQTSRCTMPAPFGDTIYLVPEHMHMNLEGKWHIDFTAPAPTIPKEVVRYTQN